MKISTLYRCIAAMFFGAAICNIALHDWTELIADVCAACLALQLASKIKNT